MAETEDVLAEACDLVEIDYADLPAVFEPDEALNDGASAVHDEGNLLSEWNIDTGDIAAAFALADVVVEAIIRPRPWITPIWNQRRASDDWTMRAC